MPDKKVEVEVLTDAKLDKVQALEEHVNQLKRQKLQLDIETNTSKLQETEQRIQSLKVFLDTVNTGNTNIHIDDSEIKKAEEELARLESEKIDLELDIETSKIEQTRSEIDSLDNEKIQLDIDNQTALQAVDQISQGFDRLKQGASEIKEVFSGLLSSAGAQEMNKTFLEMNLGASGAKSALQDINSIVATLPGDDTALQGLLSQAAAKNAGITRSELEGMAVAATDYFSAMSFYGKSATEAQQDMTNYILSGNTAELERSPILQGHIDKLKEGTTIQERSKLLSEALNEEGWGGISQQDTYNNKLETFNGMLERGKYNLGGMFQEGAKAGMDFLLKLDEATNGAVGMGIALGGLASPLFDTVSGFGQMAVGMKAIKDLGMIKWLKELELMTIVMSLNPIVLVAIALAALIAVLVWAYYNVDWFREAVDNLGKSLGELAGLITSSISGTIQWLSEQFQNFTSQLGLNTNDWMQAILGFILFLPQLPMYLGQVLLDAIAKALGFGDNFTQNMITSATRGVNGFISAIVGFPAWLWSILVNAYNRVIQFGVNFVNGLVNKALSAVNGFSNAVQGIPRALQSCLDWAYNLVMSHPLVQALVWLGQQAANAFAVIGLGQRSPGKIVKALKQELNWASEAVRDSDLANDTAGLGSRLSDSFNPDLGGRGGFGNGSSGTGGGDLIVNIYGDVDNEERARFIIETFRKEISWHNQTAGRTN